MMRRWLDRLMRRLGYIRAPQTPPDTPAHAPVPAPAVPVLTASLINTDPIMHDVMTRSMEIARVIRAAREQEAAEAAALDALQAQADVAALEGRTPQSTHR